MEQKIRKATENFDLTEIEIRKIFSAAKKRNKGKLVEFESWYTNGVPSEWGYMKVECHMMDALNNVRLADIVIDCCLFDRRKSFVQ
jgi:hypothetical protein